MERSRRRTAAGAVWVVVVVIVLVAVAMAILRRQWIVDWWVGMQYEPSAEMVGIRESLELTKEGEFLFKAVMPSLDEAEEFNANCHQEASETAVLGCYAGGRVRVYNVTTAELTGIREVTTAHELLHAVWTRLGAVEREELSKTLEAVWVENQEILGGEVGLYTEDEKREEIYVRAGTEVAELPEVLEEHFAKYFSNRQQIVQFYNGYIAVLNENRERAEALEKELPGLKKEIDAKIMEHETAAAELDEEVVEFNECAQKAGCFESQIEFSARRAELLAEQETLRARAGEINDLIAGYNAKVDEHNQIVEDSRKLQQEINSNGLMDVEL